MGLGDKDDWSVVRRKEWLVTIRGLPCRLSISDCFSIIIYDKWLLHTMTFRSSPICHLMPSWFHLIGIALKHFFLPFSFRCSWFCIWFKFAAFPPFSFYPLRFCMGSTIRPSVFKMPSEQCQSCQGSQRLLIGSVSRSVLLIKHLSVSTSYYPAWFFFFFLTCNSLCGLNVWKLISWLPLLGVRGSNGFTVLCLMPCFLVLLLIICCHHVVRQKTALVHLTLLQNSLVHTTERQTKAPDDICACFKALLCHKRSLKSL